MNVLNVDLLHEIMAFYYNLFLAVEGLKRN